MAEKQDALAVQSPTVFQEQPLRITEAQASKLSRLAAFTPVNLTEAIALSKLIANSDLAPKEYRGKPGNVLIAMQLGAELGVPPMSALANISVINGRASVWGDLALALVQVHPAYEGHKEFFEGSGETRRAIFQIKRKSQEWHQSVFSVADAKTAKLWGKRGYNGQDTPWITNPDRMLQMRARGFGLRDKFADALKGLILAEEAMDLPPDMGKSRESGTLDVGREIATLSVSSEPNRGHGNEGMAQAPALASPSMDQSDKKPEPTMCAACGQIGKHSADCKYAAKGKCSECSAEGGHLPSCSQRATWEASHKTPPAAPEPSPDAQQSPQPPQTTSEQPKAPESSVRKKALLKCVKITERHKDIKDNESKVTGKQTYFVLNVVDNETNEWDLYVWDKNLHERAVTLGGKVFLAEFSEKKGANNRVYCSLKGIIEVVGEQNQTPESDPEFA